MVKRGHSGLASILQDSEHLRSMKEWENRVPRLEIAPGPPHQLFKRRQRLVIDINLALLPDGCKFAISLGSLSPELIVFAGHQLPKLSARVGSGSPC